MLSTVCDKVYSETPIMNNELFNKQKLSGTISAARKNFLRALIEHSTEINLGFDADKYPPEKTIYFSLLKNTGLHVNGDFAGVPSEFPILCHFGLLVRISCKPLCIRLEKYQKFIKILSSQPYKLKQGFIDFWVPTYLFIKRQDYALYSISMGAYMPNVNIEFFECFKNILPILR